MIWQAADVDLGLAGRSFVVTGGSSGIGLATARVLLDEGAAATICGRDLDRLRAAATELASPQLHVVQADVTDADDAARVVAEALERNCQLDGVAALAGQGRHGSLLELDLADINTEVTDKLAAFMNVVRPAVEPLRESRGAIVGLTAPTGFEPAPPMGAIGVGRAALTNAIRALAAELAPSSVRVNGVGVGVIDTPRQRGRHASEATHVSYSEWLAAEADRRNTPLRRAGTADEVANAIVYLLSSRSSYTTGAILDVTGGHRST